MFIYLFVGGVVAILIIRYRRFVRNSMAYADKAAAPVKRLLMPVPQQYRDILQKYFPFYQQLTRENKTRFAQKVANFIYVKRFVPRNVDEVTIEAKVLIAASAVQLTFGLPDVYLRHFRTILVYPDNYYSSITRRYHKGEVNPRFGLIVLSWQAFVDGYIHPTDSKNLGLHEMAHALRLENIIRNGEDDFFDDVLLAEFDAWSEKICDDPQQDFFRPYACVSTDEFFSVAVENFFERSRQFREKLPDLYAILVKLLNQDPLQLIDPNIPRDPVVA